MDFLDESFQLLEQGKYDEGMENLIIGLRSLWLEKGIGVWRAESSSQILTHPIRKLVHQCPFTAHAYMRPRGYPGDAALIDYIYGLVPSYPDNDLAEGIYSYTINAPASAAVRYRREFIAKKISNLIQSKDSISILSLAAGHLREAELVDELESRRVKWLAIDQDSQSVALINECYGNMGVMAESGSVRDVVSGKYDSLHNFDLVYALGLYDYLGNRLAKKLLEKLLAKVKMGGQLVIANFLPNVKDIGYMESFMNWSLIYRSERQTCELFKDLHLPRDTKLTIHSEIDASSNIVLVIATLRD